jgi:Tfp pilus assembly protein PilN
MPQNINLYEAPRRKAGAPVTLRGVAASAALLLAGLACMHWIELQRSATLNDRLVRMRADKERLERQLTQLPTPQASDARLQQDEQDVVALEQIAARLSAGALGSSGSFTEHLRALSRATTEGVWLTGIRIDNAGSRLTLEGRALDAARVPQLFTALRSEKLFEGMQFATLELKALGDAAQASASPAPVPKGQPQLVQFRIRTPEPVQGAAPAPVATAPAGAPAAAAGAGTSALLAAPAVPAQGAAR